MFYGKSEVKIVFSIHYSKSSPVWGLMVENSVPDSFLRKLTVGSVDEAEF